MEKKPPPNVFKKRFSKNIEKLLPSDILNVNLLYAKDSIHQVHLLDISGNPIQNNKKTPPAFHYATNKFKYDAKVEQRFFLYRATLLKLINVCLYFFKTVEKLYFRKCQRTITYLQKNSLSWISAKSYLSNFFNPLKDLQKTGKHSCRSVISIKLLCNFIKITLWHGCSPVNLLHIFRIPLLKNTSGGLLLDLSLLSNFTGFEKQISTYKRI